MLTDRPVQGVVMQPVGVCLPEGGEGGALFVGCMGLEPGVRLLEQDRAAGGIEGFRDRIRVQPAIADDVLEADQVLVARVHGEALVGGAVLVGRSQRQHLPDAAAGTVEKIDKRARRSAEAVLEFECTLQ